MCKEFVVAGSGRALANPAMLLDWAAGKTTSTNCKVKAA
jgi:hypothetical protein